MRYGLLGEKLGHSHSPLIYELAGLSGYQLFELPPDEVEGFIRGGNLAGLNVTIPYKKKVLPLCDILSDEARRLGNVNTLRWDDKGKIHGYNTDYAGFLYMLQRAGIVLTGRKVLVLGTGGAAQAAALAAQDLGACSVVQISRTGSDNYSNLDRHADAQILVNATPVGMYPSSEESPISLDRFPKLEGVADLVYNPLRTRLYMDARERGIPCTGGLSMLAGQGCAAAEIFLGQKLPESETPRIYAALLRKVENIVLVGMPGSGKSILGKMLAERLKRRLLDTDEIINAQAGRSPAEIIEQDGEALFRKIESAVLRNAAREIGIVLTTGGGAVLSHENRVSLRQNGRVYWLRRPLEQLARENRPLSKNLPALYAARRPIYEAVSDCAVDFSEDMDWTLQQVLEEFDEYTGAQRS